MLDKLFGGTYYLEKGLDASWLRNEVIANNIANGDTPDFKSSHVEFETMLKKAMSPDEDSFEAKKTREKHMDFGDNEEISLDPLVVENSETTMRMDGNNVDIDYEETELAKNQIYYNILVQKLNKQLGRMKLAIKDGR